MSSGSDRGRSRGGSARTGKGCMKVRMSFGETSRENSTTYWSTCSEERGVDGGSNGGYQDMDRVTIVALRAFMKAGFTRKEQKDGHMSASR